MTPDAQARLRQAYMALGEGRAADALALTTPLVQTPPVDALAQQIHAAALAASGRAAEALPFARAAVAAEPRDLAALIRLLAILDSLHQHREVARETELAFSRGAEGPTLRLLHARALAGLGRLDEAEAALRMITTQAPAFIEAQHGLANLVWSRTADAAAATAAIDTALATLGETTALRVLKAEVFNYAGRAQEAYATLATALSRPGADPALHVAAAQMAVPLDPQAAKRHALAAAAAGAGADARLSLCEARLALGEAADAEGDADALLSASPDDQHLIALKATAERLQGRAGWAALHDYPAVVGVYALEAPEGWADMTAFLHDLSGALTGLHTTRTHPVGQSVRDGTQTTQNLLASDDPAIRGLFRALDWPIRRHIAELGEGTDPLRRRNLGGYAYAGAWSVRLKAGGGRHADHVHPAGWLSSACYIDVPTGAQGDDRAGWIKFGEPGTPTAPPLAAEHFVRPEPGRLVLFPSYMWHGVTPFAGEEARLTVAFDLVPSETTPTFG